MAFVLQCFSLFVCLFVCRLKIFVPSVSSLQFLTLGTRSVLCSFYPNGSKASVDAYIHLPMSTFGGYVFLRQVLMMLTS